MKKLFTLAILAIFSFTTAVVSAQTPRMAFVEEATQASCGPCAGANPGIQTLMNANSETSIFLAYQVWWPGFDQMYLDNSAEVDVRVGDYYGYEFAPQVVLQGSFVGGDGSTDNLTQGTLDAVSAEMSEFAMSVSAEVVDGILNITGSVEAEMVAEGDFKLRIMLAEDIIYATDAPGGTNGESEYHHVFKSFIGGVNGIDLEDSWAVGDTYEINESIDLGGLTIYHFDGLEVMAIVQNDANKFVHQAAKDHDIEITTNFENSAAAIEIEGLPNSVCTGEQTLSPVFVLSNNGNMELTSATITYSINGGADQTMDWTGSLTTLASAAVTLDAYTFDAVAANTISVTVSMPNGVADENSADNNTAVAELPAAPDAGSSVIVEIITDQYADETYWEIRNSGGTVIASGGNPNVGTENIGTGEFPPPTSTESYANNSTNSIPVSLPAIDCYTFHITDYYGDGILEPGLYSVKDGNGNVIITEGNLIDEEMNDFSTSVVGIEELNITSFNIYPNPAQNIANITINSVESRDLAIEVLDLTGKVVYTESFGRMNAGEQHIMVDTEQLDNGIYFFNIISGSEVISEKVSVIK